MPRKARKYVNAPFYHVMCQGIKKENIFGEFYNCDKYMFLLNKYKSDFFIDIIAYCIMPNHVHLLLHSKNPDLISKFMHKVNLIYAIHYNENNQRVGYVFRDRFRMEEINDAKYFYSCISYIHHNPVKANLCKTEAEYKYSSYNEYHGVPSIINTKIIEDFFGKNIYVELSNIIFLDIENTPELVAKEIIKNFEKIKQQNITEIMKNYNSKKELLIELHIKHKISYRCIEKLLNIKRRKIPYYLYDQTEPVLKSKSIKSAQLN